MNGDFFSSLVFATVAHSALSAGHTCERLPPPGPTETQNPNTAQASRLETARWVVQVDVDHWYYAQYEPVMLEAAFYLLRHNETILADPRATVQQLMKLIGYWDESKPPQGNPEGLLNGHWCADPPKSLTGPVGGQGVAGGVSSISQGAKIAGSQCGSALFA